MPGLFAGVGIGKPPRPSKACCAPLAARRLCAPSAATSHPFPQPHAVAIWPPPAPTHHPRQASQRTAACALHPPLPPLGFPIRWHTPRMGCGMRRPTHGGPASVLLSQRPAASLTAAQHLGGTDTPLLTAPARARHCSAGNCIKSPRLTTRSAAARPHLCGGGAHNTRACARQTPRMAAPRE